MKTITERQAEHLSTLIEEQGITQRSFSEELKFSPTSVNRWCTGKARMRDDSAEKIHEHYPEYSVGWLQGADEERDPMTQMLREVADNFDGYRRIDDAVRILIEARGYMVSMRDSDRDLHLADVQFPDGVVLRFDSDSDVQKDFDCCLADDQRETVITSTQWNYLKDEITEYIAMRVFQLLDRGKW